LRRRGNIETGVGGERRAGNFAAVGCEHVYDDKYELEDEEKIESGRKSREVGYECDDEYYGGELGVPRSSWRFFGRQVNE
tara:strand:- start:1019 stop:1258 length:240 start_codon:yes stop_codon:yes gene_type:complete